MVVITQAFNFMSKNTLALIYTGIITFGFFTAGVLDVLDYFIVKALLFVAVVVLFIIIFMIVNKNENKNHLK